MLLLSWHEAADLSATPIPHPSSLIHHSLHCFSGYIICAALVVIAQPYFVGLHQQYKV